MSMGSRRLGAAFVLLLATDCGGSAFQTAGESAGDQGSAGDTGLGGHAGTGGSRWGKGGGAGTGGSDTQSGGSTGDGGGATQSGGSTGDGGGVAVGGTTGSGGGIPDASPPIDGTTSPCIELRALVYTLLSRAQACTGQDPSECQAEVQGTCCPEIVTFPDSPETTNYLAELDKLRSAGCMTACTASLCLTGTGKCSFSSPEHTGSCIRTGGITPY
jgi:hypothetical protein